MKPLLIIKTGATLEQLIDRGDFEDWFTADWDGEVTVHDARETIDPPAPAKTFCGAIVTGSAAMVSHREPWSEALVPWVCDAHGKVPLLGVCYGHQLVAHALGGEVGSNPRGREIGTHDVLLNANAEDDPLCRDLPKRFRAQTSHSESVLKLPGGTRILAHSDLDPHHILHFGRQSWGMQYHPEFDAEIVTTYLTGRREDIESEGLNVDDLIRQVQESPHATQSLNNFLEIAGRSG